MKPILNACGALLALSLLTACQTAPLGSDDPYQQPGPAAQVPKAVPAQRSTAEEDRPLPWDGVLQPRAMKAQTQDNGPIVSDVSTIGQMDNEERAQAAVGRASAGLWSRIRQGMGIESLRGVALARMDAHDAWYRQRAEHLQRVFERARPYLFDIVQEVQTAGLPMEVALLPAVESAFLPKAVSSAQADGLWQFMAPTAQRFELRRNLFLDERRSPAAATRAALRYLMVLRDRYGGDMQLALAAYNCGEGCIDAHVRRAQARGLPGRFEDLALNPETAQYVPRLMALSRLVAEAVDADDLAGVGLPALADAPQVRLVALTRDIDKVLAAKLAHITTAELEALNPQHNKPLLVASAGQGLVLPLDKAERFEQALLEHKGPLASWTAKRVARNTTVEALARHFGVGVSVLRSVNRIAPGHLIVAGSTVLVPRLQRWDDVAEAKLHQAVLRTAPAFSVQRIKVRKGWGWREVAREVNRRGGPVTADDLRSANTKLNLKAGWMRLRVPVTETRLRLVSSAADSSARELGHGWDQPDSSACLGWLAHLFRPVCVSPPGPFVAGLAAEATRYASVGGRPASMVAGCLGGVERVGLVAGGFGTTAAAAAQSFQEEGSGFWLVRWVRVDAGLAGDACLGLAQAGGGADVCTGIGLALASGRAFVAFCWGMGWLGAGLGGCGGVGVGQPLGT